MEQTQYGTVNRTERRQPRLALFGDFGLDDACALVYVLQHRTFPVDVVAIGGNVSPAAAHENVSKLLFAAKEEGINLNDVRLVTDLPMRQPYDFLPDIHGSDGMGGFLPPHECPVPTVGYTGWLNGLHDFRILSLGPATVPADVIGHATPRGDTVIMGGCVKAEPNYNGYEFNDGIDVPSFDALLRAPHVAVTLDTCREPLFNSLIERKQGDLFSRLYDRNIQIKMLRHPDNCYIYDLIAAYALFHPESFAVETKPYRGGTIHELKLKKGVKSWL